MCEQNESSQRLDRTQVHEAYSYVRSIAELDLNFLPVLKCSKLASAFILTVLNQGFQIASRLYCYTAAMKLHFSSQISLTSETAVRLLLGAATISHCSRTLY